MTKITDFDKATSRVIAADALKAIEAVAERFGVSVKPAGGTYGGSTFVAKFEFAVIEADGTTVTRAVEEFRKYCHLYGLSQDDFGKPFQANGSTYFFSGLKIGSPKFPILGRTADGRNYKFTEQVAKQYIEQFTKAHLAKPGRDAK